MHLCVYAFSILIALLAFSGCGAEAYLWQAGGEISSTAGVMGMGEWGYCFLDGRIIEVGRVYCGRCGGEKYVLEHKFFVGVMC